MTRIQTTSRVANMDFTRTFCTLMLVCSLAAPSALLAEEAPLLRVTGSLWSPYLDQTLENNGLAADLVRSALTRAGYRIDPNAEPWSRALRGTALGVYDVVAAIWQTPERTQDLVFSEPYLLNDIIFLARASSAAGFNELDDLVGFRIGIVTDFAYGGGFDTHAGLTRLQSNHLIQNLLLLRKGSIDVIVGDKWSIYHEISRYMPNDIDEFRLLPKPLIRRALRMAVSRENTDSAEILINFNNAIAAMRKDGSYNEIVQRHTNGYVVIPSRR